MNQSAAADSWLARAVAGSQGDLNRLLERYRPMIRQMAAQITKDQTDQASPSDVAQECLIYLARSMPLFRGRTLAEFEAWLRPIVRHRVIDQIRRTQAAGRDVRRTESLFALADGNRREADNLPSQALSPCTIAVQRERLEQALQSVRVECQPVLRLHLIEGVPLPAIACQLALPLAEVVQRFARGARTLKRRLADTDESGGTQARSNHGAGK